MKIFLKFLVAIPILIVGISAIIMSVMAFDNPWLSILAVGLWFVFVFLMRIYEGMFDYFTNYVKNKILDIV